MASEITVIHVMRTYGAHGGENQLARYFSTSPAGEVSEHFAFLYRDPACRELFERSGVRATLHELLPAAIAARQNPWVELLILLPFLPFLQLRLFRLLRRLKARICVVHGFQAAVVAWPTGMLLRRRMGFLYVHRITKSISWGPPFRWLYAPYHLLGGVSRAVTRSLGEVAPQQRLVPLENGVDWRGLEQALPKAPPIPVAHGGALIAVGRLLPHKRQSLLIAAFAKLAAARPGLELWIVGDGTERVALESEAARLGVADRILFWGHRSDVPALLTSATLFVNASAQEGMSNAVLEAMALGLASVVTDAPGVTECHIDGETGLVVAANASAIAEAIATLLDDPERRKRMGEAARERVRKHYSIEANRRRFLDVYARLAAEVS
jgi:glycosyltransferase involved in cell wall biosynthesis